MQVWMKCLKYAALNDVRMLESLKLITLLKYNYFQSGWLVLLNLQKKTTFENERTGKKNGAHISIQQNIMILHQKSHDLPHFLSP